VASQVPFDFTPSTGSSALCRRLAPHVAQPPRPHPAKLRQDHLRAPIDRRGDRRLAPPVSPAIRPPSGAPAFAARQRRTLHRRPDAVRPRLARHPWAWPEGPSSGLIAWATPSS